jgi:hypothetical protein
VITATRLKEILFYNPETGSWVWKDKIARKVIVGAFGKFARAA